MEKIIEVSELPKDEKIYVKKDSFGWRIVNPIRTPDGKINVINLLFGGWRNLMFLILILLLVLGFFYIYHHDTAEMMRVVENPCSYCREQTSIGIKTPEPFNIYPIIEGEENAEG